MTLLTVWPDTDATMVLTRTDDPDQIKKALSDLGVRFDRWSVLPGLSAEPTTQEVLDLYREQIKRIEAAEGYAVEDTASIAPSDDPDAPAKIAAARQKFFAEHTHDDDEDRFFARGSGVFYLHVQANVYALLCEAGDLLSVPAHTTHWYDMSSHPDFVAIRFFHDPNGWVGNFTGSDIARHFPDADALAASQIIR
ncbi:MAG TPA: cupin [Pseudonocardiaceae bacterium]